MNSPSVWYWFAGPPLACPPPNSSGSPKSWLAPIVETTTVNRIVGRRPGSVTCRNCCQRFAPSIAAASYRSWLIDCMPAR